MERRPTLAINLLALKPNEVSRDLSGYITYIYGAGGTGKTTLASQLKKPLLIAFEMGYRAIPGIIAQDVKTWGEFKQVVKELKKPEVQENFSSLAIDTIDIAADLCEKYICAREGVEKIADIPWGGGFKMMKKEFEETFRSLSQMNYAIFFISHSKDKTFKREDGTEYNQIIPSLAPSYNEIVRNMSDIQGYAHQVSIENGTPQVMLTLRSMDGSVECKSRFKMMTNEVPFTYEALSQALHEAIDKEAEVNKNQFVTDAPVAKTTEVSYDFASLKSEFDALVKKIRADHADNFKEAWAPKIVALTDKILGRGKKVSELEESQAEVLDVIVNELKQLAVA
jgi:hypothetical protein